MVLPNKPPYPIMYLNDGDKSDLKTTLDIWMMIDVFLVEYGTLALMLYLMMRLSLLLALPSVGMVHCDELLLYLYELVC